MNVREVKEQNTLRVRLVTPVSELPNVMGPIYGEIAARMQSEGVPFVGPPFALYHNMDMEALDVEIGFPVPSPMEKSGRLEPGTIPGGKVVSEIHTGPYSTLEETYNKVMAFIAAEKIKVTPWMYETYLNAPGEVPDAELKTEIFFPVEEQVKK